MSTNPYKSSVVDVEPTTIEETAQRRRAIYQLRVVFLILLVPALYNYFQFDVTYIVASPMSAATRTMCRVLNLIGFSIPSVFIWTAGLPLLERIAEFVRRAFASKADREAWNGSLYVAVNSAVYLAIPGAILWFIWVFGYYELGMNFTVISYTVGIPGHVLGACFYVPLAYRWYKLAQATPPARSVGS